MEFIYGAAQLNERAMGEKQSYLITNGLGGYSSTTVLQSRTRGDHSLFTCAINPPDRRYNLVNMMEEVVVIEGREYELTSQSYVDYTKEKTGHKYLVLFKQEELPKWSYLVEGVRVEKEVVMPYGKNTLGIKYNIYNPFKLDVEFILTPLYSFSERGANEEGIKKLEISKDEVCQDDIKMRVINDSDRVFSLDGVEIVKDNYFTHDARDGREAFGATYKKYSYIYECNTSREVDFIFSLEDDASSVTEMIQDEVKRQKEFIEKSGIKSEFGKVLVRACDQFIVRRENVDGMTIIAGYPYFLDWGRDTMYALEGCVIDANRFDEARKILKTFALHIRKGLMPNLFPEGNKDPMYNTVDASLLFIQTVYIYYKKTNDIEFVKEMYSYIEDIISNYKNGTDYDIKMEEDGLISAGSGLYQLTWMDVRYEDILPTKRHGKPVEINAYWYNALCVLCEFAGIVKKDCTEYSKLADLVKTSFTEKFWNEDMQCLKDVVSGEYYDTQIRPNQIWAVSVPFSPLSNDRAKKVVECVGRYLYTPYGLRSLDEADDEFAAEYSGCLKKRDLSYHQGTVWNFPIGSYYRAYLKVNEYSEESMRYIGDQLEYMKTTLYEGCVGQVAEIFDGLFPYESRGCYAQAWSVGEIYKIVKEIEEARNVR